MKKHEPMTEERLAAIKELAEAATPGPWGLEYVELRVLAEGESVCLVCGQNRRKNEENALFIYHAREDVPALLAEVERLRDEVAHLRDENEALKNSAFEFGVVFSTKVNEMRAWEDWLITQILGKKNIFSCPMPERHKCKQRDGQLCYLDPSKTEIRRKCWRKAADMATRENPGKSG